MKQKTEIEPLDHELVCRQIVQLPVRLPLGLKECWTINGQSSLRSNIFADWTSGKWFMDWLV